MLLLKNSYEALGIISSKKAVKMLLSKKVDYIEKTKELIRSEKLLVPIQN